MYFELLELKILFLLSEDLQNISYTFQCEVMKARKKIGHLIVGMEYTYPLSMKKPETTPPFKEDWHPVLADRAHTGRVNTYSTINCIPVTQVPIH